MLCIKGIGVLYSQYIRTLYYKFYILSLCLLTFDVPNLSDFLSFSFCYFEPTTTSQLEKTES